MRAARAASRWSARCCCSWLRPVPSSSGSSRSATGGRTTPSAARRSARPTTATRGSRSIGRTSPTYETLPRQGDGRGARERAARSGVGRRRTCSWGIVAAYQGDIERTFRSLANARRLAPRAWTSYTNIVETLIYKGSPRRDDRALDRPRRAARRELGRGRAESRAWSSWRDGNMEGAERHFRRVRRLDPTVLESWNEAPVPKPIETLADLMSYCCGSPACGPVPGRRVQGVAARGGAARDPGGGRAPASW